MKSPLDIMIDTGVVYVRYEDDDGFDGSLALVRGSGGTVHALGTDDPGFVDGGVTVDLSDSDSVIGIEIVRGSDPLALALARDYAAAHGLAFPARLEPARHSA